MPTASWARIVAQRLPNSHYPLSKTACSSAVEHGTWGCHIRLNPVQNSQSKRDEYYVVPTVRRETSGAGVGKARPPGDKARTTEKGSRGQECLFLQRVSRSISNSEGIGEGYNGGLSVAISAYDGRSTGLVALIVTRAKMFVRLHYAAYRVLAAMQAGGWKLCGVLCYAEPTACFSGKGDHGRVEDANDLATKR